jgi:hypothetical protein
MEAPALFARVTAANPSRTTRRTLFLAALVVLSLVSLVLKTNSGLAQTATESIAVGQNTSLPSPGQVQDMKLLAPDVGWVLQQNHLYWTEDNGAHWEDITPPLSGKTIDGVFFVNASYGWVVISDPPPTALGVAAIHVASTKDGGRHWVFTPINTPKTTGLSSYAGMRSMFFLDSRYGWIVLGLRSSSNSSLGVLLFTDDGGTTWIERPSLPEAGSIRFLTTQDGWLAGGRAGGDLWSTHDGGITWASMAISVPIDCSGCRVQSGLPSFQDLVHGFLSVYINSVGHNYVAVYGTYDGGHSWQNTDVIEYDSIVATSSVESHVVRAFSSTDRSLTIQFDRDAVTTVIPEKLLTGKPVSVQFTDSHNGWIIWSAEICTDSLSRCTRQQEVLSATDGGRTLGVITPPLASAAEEAAPTISAPIPISAAPIESAGSQISLGAALIDIPLERSVAHSQAIGPIPSAMSKGFDMICGLSPTSMQSLWSNANNSYRNTGIYLGGCDVSCVPPTGIDSCGTHFPTCTISSDGTKCTYPPPSGKVKSVNTHLTPSDLSTTLTQGWGLIPAWVGEQAPSPCQYPANAFFSIGTSPLSEGAAEADAAMARANSLGIIGIIYYDMEYYSPGYTSCSATVVSFLQGWVNELQSHGYKAGIYIHNLNKSDLASMSPKPDSTWVTDWGSTATTAPTTLSTYWINQYCNDGTIASGNYCSDAVTQGSNWIDPIIGAQVDEDMVNGYVVSTGGANSSPTVTSFSIVPTTATVGTRLTATITGTVGSNPLTTAYLMRTTNLTQDAGWAPVDSTPVSGSSINVTLHDTPSIGTYRYGAQLYDTANNHGHEPSTIQVTITSAPVKTTPTVTMSPNGATITTAQSLPVTVTVSGTSGGATPTGTVTLTAGGNTAQSSSLSNGSAQFTINGNTLPANTCVVVTVNYLGDSNYNSTSFTGSVNVNPVSKTTPTITWNTPAAITYGTALSTTQLNASASVGGSYSYSPQQGAVLTAGSQTLTVTFTPTDTTDYNTATKSVTLTVNKATPSITWNTPAAVTVGTALSATQLNPTASVAGNFSYSPTSGTVMSSAGNVTLSATFTPNDTTDYNSNSANVVLTVNALSTPIITFTVPSHTYGDAPFTVSATSNSSGTITYSVISGPSAISGSTVTLTGAGTVVLQASQAAAGSYTLGTQIATFTVAGQAPTINFAVPNHTYGDAAFSVVATSNSSGVISYSVVSGPATISGSTVTLTGAGTVVLQASQTASGNYAAKVQTATFTVAGNAPTIAFTVPNHSYGDAPFTVSATSNSLGAITYSVVSGPATISGSTATLTGAGSVVLQASQAAAGSYTLGTQIATFTVAGQAPTINFAVPNHTYGDGAFSVIATSNSSGVISYSVVSGPATISGSTVTLTGAGTVVLQVSQIAAGNYAAKVQTATFTIAGQVPTISFTVPNHSYGDAPFTVSATSNSSGVISYSVTSGPATIFGSTVTLTGAGTVVLQASQIAVGNYAAGAQNATFTVGGNAPTITFTVPNHTYGDAPFTVSATSSSSGAITYSVTSGPATISGSTVTLTGAGTVGLSANQVASGSYVAAATITSFAVAPGVMLSGSGSTSATTTSGGTAIYGLTLNPGSGLPYPDALTLSATGQPTGATVTFTPQTVPAGSGSTYVMLAIQVPQKSAALIQNRDMGRGLVPVALGLLLLPFAGRMRRSGKRLGLLACLLLLLAGAGSLAGVTGCGGDPSQVSSSTHNYTVVVTATDVTTGTTISTNLALTVE